MGESEVVGARLRAEIDRLITSAVQSGSRQCRHTLSNTGVDPDNFVNTPLFNYVALFHFQIEAASHSFRVVIKALKAYAFLPPWSDPFPSLTYSR